jgi:very-long-chain (3R)-3-hydroxyacyl-CoA dehydratase
MVDVKEYLISYNVLSTFLWGAVLARLAILFPLVGTKFVAGGLADFTRWVQTVAILEIIHALIGWVKSPLFTTVTQVYSRLLLVWGILYLFPDVGDSLAFSTMVFAWSVTEIIRYSYYAFNLYRDGQLPKTLVWLRYNTFFVLYPLGAGSEVFLVYQSLDQAEAFNPWYALYLKIAILVYIPGFYMLYTHMIKQRRRVLKNLGKRKQDKRD